MALLVAPQKEPKEPKERARASALVTTSDAPVTGTTLLQCHDGNLRSVSRSAKLKDVLSDEDLI